MTKFCTKSMFGGIY